MNANNRAILERIREVFSEDAFDITSLRDYGEDFLFSIKKRGDNGEPLDPWYTIDKQTGRIDGFVVHEYNMIQ